MYRTSVRQAHRHAALLLLAEGRLPNGAYAHSGGLEAAVDDGRVTDLDDLAAYLDGRLATAGTTEAGLAAATLVAVVDGDPDWALLDAEAAARTPSPALRRASRSLGRSTLRAGVACWPSPTLDACAAALPAGPMVPVALGAVGAVAGLDPYAVGVLAASAAISGPATAAVRLLGLDPLRVHRLLAERAEAVDGIAATAAGATATPVPLADLATRAGPGSPLVDAAAERHASAPAKLFAS